MTLCRESQRVAVISAFLRLNLKALIKAVKWLQGELWHLKSVIPWTFIMVTQLVWSFRRKCGLKTDQRNGICSVTVQYHAAAVALWPWRSLYNFVIHTISLNVITAAWKLWLFGQHYHFQWGQRPQLYENTFSKKLHTSKITMYFQRQASNCEPQNCYFPRKKESQSWVSCALMKELWIKNPFLDNVLAPVSKLD